MRGSDGKVRDTLKYEVLVVDEKKAKVRSIGGLEGRLTLSPKENGQAPPETVVYAILHDVDVMPGHFEFRVSATSAKLAKGGSAYLEFDVPDFDGTPLVMSGVVVGPANRGGGSARIAKMREVASVIPVATRTFSRGDLVSAFTSVRTTKQAYREPVDVTTAIYRSAVNGEDGTEVFRRTDRKETANAERGADHVFPLPLDTLEAGDYLLRVTASSSARNIPPVARELRFAVR